MSNKKPIGLFDSGVGGTSIWKEVHALLPNESTIYLADSKNAPYGQKTQEEIIELSKKNTAFLLENNCKLIIVACNTATTNAIKVLRATYDIPFIGIEPAIKPAALHSKTQKIGILATQGTLNSELFHQTVALYSDVKVVEQIGFDLVTLIENGEMHSKRMTQLLNDYLLPGLKPLGVPRQLAGSAIPFGYNNIEEFLNVLMGRTELTAVAFIKNKHHFLVA